MASEVVKSKQCRPSSQFTKHVGNDAIVAAKYCTENNNRMGQRGQNRNPRQNDYRKSISRSCCKQENIHLTQSLTPGIPTDSFSPLAKLMGKEPNKFKYHVWMDAISVRS